MEQGRPITYAIVLIGVTVLSTVLLLGVPWAGEPTAATTGSPTHHHGYRSHGWYYSHYGGGHGGWMGRGFGWGSFGEFGSDDGGFRSGGPGFGK